MISIPNGKSNQKGGTKNIFVPPFITRKYPHAFDFMDNGFEFLVFMIGIAFLYFWIISPEIDKLIGDKTKEVFNYGDWLKSFGKTTVKAPEKIFNFIKGSLQKTKGK